MEVVRNIYIQKLHENERQSRFWEDYIHKLKSLDFNVFSDKLKVPSLIPIGSRILFRGELIHTNEVTVALGEDYFVKCSTTQAGVIKKHRISVAESKLEELGKEKDYFEKQLNFKAENSEITKGHEIIEPFHEDDELKWREKHRENVKKFKQSYKINFSSDNNYDEDLWFRLEELELQEELENEYSLGSENNKGLINQIQPKEVFNETLAKDTDHAIIQNSTKFVKDSDNESLKNYDNDLKAMLHQALDKQKQLESKLLKLKNRTTPDSKSESDLIERLDELEELDELEDEMDRLDDMLFEETQDVENEDSNNGIKKSVSFADFEENETIQITFTHNENEPVAQPYDPVKGILKPSDIYEAYSSLNPHTKKTVSILKKINNNNFVETESKDDSDNHLVLDSEQRSIINQPVIVNDVNENIGDNIRNIHQEHEQRPPSLFKTRRLQKK